MTINRLHKYLAQLVAEGHGRKAVMIDKGSFTHPLESDGCMILPADGAEIKRFLISDDDGGTKMRQDGTECSQSALVFFGNDREHELSP